ncbi:hypothetical protein RRG08_015090 [Elysia crispata]|uniref:Uncharacterized protein n=1 Tax=Elysia crispata TaxID=231223 RepID=A0AAE1B6G9_9GAST|nr:hypothetical protein RRG08_015090 [Elysia crispata]
MVRAAAADASSCKRDKIGTEWCGERRGKKNTGHVRVDLEGDFYRTPNFVKRREKGENKLDLVKVTDMCYKGLVKDIGMCYKGLVKVTGMCYKGLVKDTGMCYKGLVKDTGMCYKGLVKDTGMCYKGLVKDTGMCYKGLVKVTGMCYKGLVNDTGMCYKSSALSAEPTGARSRIDQTSPFQEKLYGSKLGS